MTGKASPIDTPETDPRWVQFTEGGRVHIFRDYRSPLTGRTADTVADWFVSSQRALCGKVGAPGGLFGVGGDFDDADLCHRCYDLTPEDQRDALFDRPL